MDKAAKRVVCAYGAAGVLSPASVWLHLFCNAGRIRLCAEPAQADVRGVQLGCAASGESQRDSDGLLLCARRDSAVRRGGGDRAPFVQRDSVLPIRGRWKLILPLGGFVAAALCCHAEVHRAEHLRMYMEFLPLEFASLVLLGLLLAGLLARRQHELRR